MHHLTVVTSYRLKRESQESQQLSHVDSSNSAFCRFSKKSRISDFLRYLTKWRLNRASVVSVICSRAGTTPCVVGCSYTSSEFSQTGSVTWQRGSCTQNAFLGKPPLGRNLNLRDEALIFWSRKGIIPARQKR